MQLSRLLSFLGIIPISHLDSCQIDPALPNPAKIFRLIISLLRKVTRKLYYTDVFDEGRGTKPLGTQQRQKGPSVFGSCLAPQGSLWPCTEVEKELRPGVCLQDFLKNVCQPWLCVQKVVFAQLRKQNLFACLFCRRGNAFWF